MKTLIEDLRGASLNHESVDPNDVLESLERELNILKSLMTLVYRSANSKTARHYATLVVRRLEGED